MDFFEAFFCGIGGGGGDGGGRGWREAAAAASVATLVFTPMVHFLAFYAFWHCVCMGLAELTGYPDQFFYGKGRGELCPPPVFLSATAVVAVFFGCLVEEGV